MGGPFLLGVQLVMELVPVKRFTSKKNRPLYMAVSTSKRNADEFCFALKEDGYRTKVMLRSVKAGGGVLDVHVVVAYLKASTVRTDAEFDAKCRAADDALRTR